MFCQPAIEATDNHQTCFLREHKHALAITTAVLICLSALVASYFWDPHFHTFVNQIAADFMNTHLTVGQSLLYIALPIGGIALAIGLIAHVHRTYKKTAEEWEDALHKPSITEETIKKLKPTAEEWKVAGIVAASLALVGIIGFVVFQYVTPAHEWITPLLNHPIALWEGLSYAGGGTAVLAIAIGLSIRVNQYYKEQAKENDLWQEIYGSD